MSHLLVKTGACSIVLGSGHFGSFYPKKKDKLFKVTKIVGSHNEFTYLHHIRKIPNYRNYYSIPDSEVYTIDPSSEFYKQLIILTQNEQMSIFNGNLYGFYIDFGGSSDLHDLIIEMEIWYEYE